MKAATIFAAVVFTSVLGGYAFLDREMAAGKPNPPCAPQFGRQPQVGNLLKIVDHEVHRGKTRLKVNTAPLFTNSTLCTDSDGEVRFLVRPLKKTTCVMYRSARLRLYPPKLDPSHRQVVIRFEKGKTWCGTGEDPTENEKKFDARKGTVRLLMKDPLFGVDVDTQRTIVKVVLGYVEVSRRAGGGAVIVGPGQQVTVPEGGVPRRVGPRVPNALDNSRFGGLKPVLPKPNLGPPDPGGSRALERIFNRRALTVGIADDLVRDSRTPRFVVGFFDFLASSWGVRSGLVRLRTPDWVRTLEAERVDVALTPDLTPLTSSNATFDVFPLFADRQGAVWHAVLLEDEVFLRALRRFVQQAVTSGDYARVYRASFAQEPSYGPLRPVLFG